MTFPYITAVTAGFLLLMQMALAFTVSGNRGKTDTWVGDGGNAGLLRTARRHGNLAENAGIFVAGLTLLELSRFSPKLLVVLCAALVVARILHAAGLTQQNTKNALRLLGGVGTYLIGFNLGGALIWVGLLGSMGGQL
jgi:uncharacterized membrane protein YecN with MAPEG domain